MGAEHRVHLREPSSARIPAKPFAQPAVGAQQQAEHGASGRVGLGDLTHDAFVDQIEKLRHTRKDGDAALLQGLKQRRGADTLQEHHAAAGDG